MSFAHRSNPPVPTLAALAVLGAAQWACAQPLPCRYEVAAVIQAPPGPTTSSPTFGNAISPNGRYVVGSYRFDAVSADKAYYYDMQTQQFTPLPLLPGTFTSQALDVNDAGQIAGKISIPAGDKGFVYSISTGQYTLLEPMTAEGVCEATGINSQGVVCGTRSIGSKSDPVFPKTAFIWSPGGFHDLGVMAGPSSFATDIAEDGTVVGYTGGNDVSTFTRGFVWNLGRVTTLPPVEGGLNSLVRACGSSTTFAVDGRLPGSPLTMRSFVHTSDALAPLGVLSGFDSMALGDCNGSGTTLGTARRFGSPNINRGFVFERGILRNLDDLLELAAPYTVLSGDAINAPGWIVSSAHNQQGARVALVMRPTVVQGDARPDCAVNVDDIVEVILQWGHGDTPADVTGDSLVDVEDLILVITSWTFGE